MSTAGGLRERTRRAVRAELTEVAQELFLAQGFELTTIDQIASAAGMSKRSFFRYFGSKEELMLARQELLADQLVEALSARPLDEPVWQSLRLSLQVVVDYYADAQRQERAAALQRIIETSPALSAGYLERFAAAEDRLAELLRRRAAQRGERVQPGDEITRATVGAAFACLLATISAALAAGDPRSLGARLDAVMDALRPASA